MTLMRVSWLLDTRRGVCRIFGAVAYANASLQAILLPAQAGNENEMANRVRAHAGGLFHHVRHGAALGDRHAMVATWAGNADDSHGDRLLVGSKFAFVVFQTAHCHGMKKPRKGLFFAGSIMFDFNDLVGSHTHIARMANGAIG